MKHIKTEKTMSKYSRKQRKIQIYLTGSQRILAFKKSERQRVIGNREEEQLKN